MLPSMRLRLRAACAATATVLLAAAAASGADLVQEFIRRHWSQPLAPQGPPPARFSPLEASLQPESCGTCHPAPFYTDNLMHDLKVDRFYKPQEINGLTATKQGPIKTFPLRGIKESPPYLHDGRLLTLDDTVEFFNLILGTDLTSAEKGDLVAFLKTL